MIPAGTGIKRTAKEEHLVQHDIAAVMFQQEMPLREHNN